MRIEWTGPARDTPLGWMEAGIAREAPDEAARSYIAQGLAREAVLERRGAPEILAQNRARPQAEPEAPDSVRTTESLPPGVTSIESRRRKGRAPSTEGDEK